MELTLRAQRLRLPWLLALPFLLIVQPTPTTLLFGSLVTLPGLCLRVVASGYIQKDRTLTVEGPFALLRHPLYLGSFFVGLGLVLGGGVPVLLFVYLPLFAWLYYRTARREEEELEHRFGDAYAAYRRRVPALVPPLLPALSPAIRLAVTSRLLAGEGAEEPEGAAHDSDGEISRASTSGFQLRLFLLNRGWEAPLGTLGGFGLLWGKMLLFL